MKTRDKVVKALMKRSGVKAEVERIEREEDELVDALLKTGQAAGLAQAELAARMGTQAPAVARPEKSLAIGKYSPLVATDRCDDFTHEAMVHG